MADVSTAESNFYTYNVEGSFNPPEGYVPYTGAQYDVDLGEHILTAKGFYLIDEEDLHIGPRAFIYAGHSLLFPELEQNETIATREYVEDLISNSGGLEKIVVDLYYSDLTNHQGQYYIQNAEKSARFSNIKERFENYELILGEAKFSVLPYDDTTFSKPAILQSTLVGSTDVDLTRFDISDGRYSIGFAWIFSGWALVLSGYTQEDIQIILNWLRNNSNNYIRFTFVTKIKMSEPEKEKVQIKTKTLTLKWVMPTYQIESAGDIVNVDVSYDFIKKMTPGEEQRMIDLCNQAGGNVQNLDEVVNFLITAVTTSASQKDTFAFLSYVINWDSVQSYYMEQGVMAEPWIAKGPLICTSFGLDYKYHLVMVGSLGQLIQIPDSQADSNNATFQYTITENIEQEFDMPSPVLNEGPGVYEISLTNNDLTKLSFLIFENKKNDQDKTLIENLNTIITGYNREAGVNIPLIENIENIANWFNIQKETNVAPLIVSTLLEELSYYSSATQVKYSPDSFSILPHKIITAPWTENYTVYVDGNEWISSSFTNPTELRFFVNRVSNASGSTSGGSGSSENLEDITNIIDFVGKVMSKIDVHATYNGSSRIYSVKVIGSTKATYNAIDQAVNTFRNQGMTIPTINDRDSFTNAINIIHSASPLAFVMVLKQLLENTYMVIDRQYSEGTYDYTILNGDDAGLWYFVGPNSFINLFNKIGEEAPSFTDLWGVVND